MQREVTHIVSPGHDRGPADARCEAEQLPRRDLCRARKGGYGFAFVDLTTGDFRLTELADDKELADELARVQPAEVLVSEEQAAQFRERARDSSRATATPFCTTRRYFTLREHFKVQSLDGFGCDGHAGGDRRGGRDPALSEDELRRSLEPRHAAARSIAIRSS